jgi:hypothetical protein
MSPDLLRGMGKSIGGDLDVDDEGSEQYRFELMVEISTLMMKAPNSIGSNPCSHYTTTLLVTNSCTHELVSPTRLCLCKQIENTSKNRKEQSRIVDE